MPPRNYSATAAYFESRAAKANGARRAQLQSIAALYHEKAHAQGKGGSVGLTGPTRRERVAEMFRAFETSDGSRGTESSSPGTGDR
jgi:hypothetical protein